MRRSTQRVVDDLIYRTLGFSVIGYPHYLQYQKCLDRNEEIPDKLLPGESHYEDVS